MVQDNPLILVGGYGFVGRNILDAVLQDPAFSQFRPLVIDNLSNACSGHEQLGLPECIAHYNDATVKPFLDQHADAPRTFIFLAGETRVAESKDRPLDFIDANIKDPAQFVMESVREGDRFILISTAGALFDGTFEINTDSVYCPKNFYGASKAAEEMVLEKLVGLRGAEFSIVRFTNVYGTHSELKKSAIHAFTRALLQDTSVTINGDGEQRRDFVFSGDVGNGVATLAKRMANGDHFDKVNMIGSGETVSLNDVVAALESAAQKPLKYQRDEAKELLATEPREVSARKSDVEVLLGENITSLSSGLKQTFHYYQNLLK
ncbi:UDP-glucose 4-epimerase [Amylibacter ulvae]|uniref:UDP-glucose 4-epimerase n=1 Tax=Paramylibacter ulvae TaxID=1651968 RepID=A0ABQ3CY83_9RHOB|nr:NAD-dependent epimerase/dehydratase family protein [Amylibacter ulvae]GHA48443.1 UDP-glucose 4-epimerase [Amylibacter ulvae]